jgi:hypothetical protein
VTGLLEADIFDPMQACGTRMAWTCLVRMQTLRFCSTLIVCVSLLMVLTPPAHGFAMLAHANTVQAAVAAPFDDGTGILAKTHPAKASQHGNGDCDADDPPQHTGQHNSENTSENVGENSGPPRDACMATCMAACPAACCSAIMTACRHPAGGVVLAETGPLLPIPPSASRGGIHPPPRSDRMI